MQFFINNFILAFFILFSQTGLAQSSLLDKVDQFLGHQEFSKAFVVGSFATYQSAMCEGSFSCEVMPLKSVVVENQNQIQIQNMDIRDGKVFSQTNITPAMWQSWSANIFRAVLGFYESYGLKVEILSVTFDQMKLAQDQQKSIPVVIVHYLANNSMVHVDETATMTSAFDGYFQLVKLESFQTGLIKRHKTVEMQSKSRLYSASPFKSALK